MPHMTSIPASIAPLRPLMPFVVALLLAGCSPIVASRGNMPPPEALEQIQVGRHTRADIATLLGSPTNVATFNDRAWYYVSQRAESFAFFAPEVVEQKVVIVRFDDSGRVSGIETRNKDAAQEVDQVSRTTPTAGHSMTVLEQLFGNIGQFGGDGKNTAPTQSGIPGGSSSSRR